MALRCLPLRDLWQQTARTPNNVAVAYSTKHNEVLTQWFPSSLSATPRPW